MKDNNIYIKLDNGRYKPFGICTQPDHMDDGIWYVRHYSRGCKATTSVPYLEGLFKLGEAKIPDIPQLCGLEDYVEYIFQSKEYNELINDKKGYSINDLFHLAVGKVFEFNEKKKNVNNKN